MVSNADEVWATAMSLSSHSAKFTAADVETAIGDNAPTNRTVRNRLNAMEQLGLLTSEGGDGRTPRTYRPTEALGTSNGDADTADVDDPRSFPYPGGKNKLTPWIRQHLPPHECYVEPFAGSAAVLIGKPRSRVEVLNDTDEMLIRVFRTIQEQPAELEGRLSEIPFSRSIHTEWRTHLDTGEWPNDDIEATARWFTLRYTQHSAKLTGSSGFKVSKVTNPARAFQNAKRAFSKLAERLDGVILESEDWESVANRYDGDETLQYFDPPYADGKGDELYRHKGEFDHSELATWLVESDSLWILSYETIPDVIDTSDNHVVAKETSYSNTAREDEGTTETTEHLIMNFDPDETATFVSEDAHQDTLSKFG